MSDQKKSIVIVGGGGLAIALASLLEKSIANLRGYEIVMITGREYHLHLIATLRANVSDQEIAEKIAIPFDKLFKNANIARIIPKHVAEVKADRVVLADGSELPFAYCVVATGKQWTAPNDLPDKRSDAIERMKQYRDKVAAAQNVLIIGGGAVGVEMAGEIAATHRGKKVTVVHSQPKLINSTYPDKFRDGLAKQLNDLGVSLLLNDSVQGDHDFTAGPLSLTTRNGQSLENVDLVIQSTGGKLNTYVLDTLAPASAVGPNGIKVEPTMQLAGFPNIFVAGDLADLPGQKQAAKLPGQAELVKNNIVALASGKALSSYKPPGEMIVVNIADIGGMGCLDVPVLGKITMGGWFAKTVKGKSLFVQQARASLGY